MRKKKSTQQLVGIESVTDSSVLTAGGELAFYLVQPTNLNVLPESGVRTRVTALLNVLKTSAEMELLALDSMLIEPCIEVRASIVSNFVWLLWPVSSVLPQEGFPPSTMLDFTILEAI